MTKTEMAYFRAAKAVSELSDHPQHKLGCVIVNKHKIISSGFNSHTKCHGLQAILDAERFGVYCPGKIHAETSALVPLIKSGIDLSRATMFVHREHKDGTLAMSRPCPSCQKLIKQAGIRKVYYTSNDGYVREDLQL